MNTTGSFITREAMPYYKISHAETLAPFFIQMASASDIWLFMSSFGGVTAGRINAQNNLFPYETDDKLHTDAESGVKVVIKVGGLFWQPFEQNGTHKYTITKNIYKGYYGNSVMIEEINHDLGVSYAYRYESSEKYGLVKTSILTNLTDEDVAMTVLDGIGNILPYGVNGLLQASKSTLVDAYKAAELVDEQMAVYSLTTQINDAPNPIEVLKANVAYTTLEGASVYLDSSIVRAFYNDQVDTVNQACYGAKCGYYILSDITLEGQASTRYQTVLDVGYDHSRLTTLRKFIASKAFSRIDADIKAGYEHLKAIVGGADGLQQTGDEVACAHHYLNTLYNVMRGGTFEEGYAFNYDDFSTFMSVRHKEAAKKSALLEKIRTCTTVAELKEVAKADTTLYRLALEYMPLSFSRRHGDPSRPWNQFNIVLKDEAGHKISRYEGNWRDIFQNWEALGLSFPGYYENMVAKFVNASTIDGFNPYRINTQGIEWEKPEADDPFSGYGYWGDHQIIYLLRLLKGMQSHFPEKLDTMLGCEIFAYANIPYIIKPYAELLKDSKDTIAFDTTRDDAIEALCKQVGTDGKLLQKDGDVYTVNLVEKLLVPLLSKVSNLLVGGGIWMNTQRPEWNDANNAIVGIGLSMVTVYHVQAYITYLKSLLETHQEAVTLSEEVASWMTRVTQVLTTYAGKYQGNEKTMLDAMGYAFSDYREAVYQNGFSGKVTLDCSAIVTFLTQACAAIDYTIAKNKEEVYATYNLLNEDFSTTPMRAMLEGQSAVIGSGCLDASEITALLDAMGKTLLDPALQAHTLYPVEQTKSFIDKNRIEGVTQPIEWIVTCDEAGCYHFDAQITTQEVLVARLAERGITDPLYTLLLDAFEANFGHKKFTGRSQVMYKFEGIGCVYWHQNAKLALAVLEEAARAHRQGSDAQAIYEAYKTITNGFIYRKTPVACQGIPVEPYSHTSFNKRSEQPGMTGQVKESVLMRRLELGVQVIDGCVSFDPWFLSEEEFDEQGKITFTLYGVPVQYTKGECDGIEIVANAGTTTRIEATTLDCDTSEALFLKTGTIQSLHVVFAAKHFTQS